MSLEVGEVVSGRVSGITKFGAFIALEGGKSGLVHISEVANAYVSDINEHLKLGQSVNVRILSIGEDGKINLSIKKAEEAPARSQERPAYRRNPAESRPAAPQGAAAHRAPMQPAPPSEDQSFEDRLKKFMQESDSRIADNRMYSDRPRKTRRR